jgi:hypothetical protein
MEDDAIALALKIPQALAFLPVNQVWEIFHDLKEKYVSDNEQVKAFYDCIEENYVGKIEVSVAGTRYKRTNKTQFQPKLFSIEDWNINSRILSDLPRTTTVKHGMIVSRYFFLN